MSKRNYDKGANRSTMLNPEYREGLSGNTYGAAGPCVSLITGKVVPAPPAAVLHRPRRKSSETNAWMWQK